MQVLVDLGIVDHVWQEMHTAVVETVDALGDSSNLNFVLLAGVHPRDLSGSWAGCDSTLHGAS